MAFASGEREKTEHTYSSLGQSFSKLYNEEKNSVNIHAKNLLTFYIIKKDEENFGEIFRFIQKNSQKSLTVRTWTAENTF